jgi:hypothetical protein
MFAQIQILIYGSFSHKHKKVDSNFKKSFLMETSMLPLNFDELNTKFEKI